MVSRMRKLADKVKEWTVGTLAFLGICTVLSAAWFIPGYAGMYLVWCVIFGHPA